MERAQIEDMIARASAETGTALAHMETRITEMNGTMTRVFDAIANMSKERDSTRAEIRSARTATVATTVGTGIALLAVIIAVLMAVPSWVGLGQQQQSALHAEVQSAVAAATPKPPSQPAPAAAH